MLGVDGTALNGVSVLIAGAGLAALAAVGQGAQVVECRGDGLVAVARQRPVAHGRAAEVVADEVDIVVAGTHAERRFAISIDPSPEA